MTIFFRRHDPFHLGGEYDLWCQPIRQGFVFDGGGDAVPVCNATGLQLHSFTVEAWIKRASTSPVSVIPVQDGLLFSPSA